MNFKHLKEVDMTYFEHMGFAFLISLYMIYGGILCFIHGIFPFMFDTAASTQIKDLSLLLNIHNSSLEGEKEEDVD